MQDIIIEIVRCIIVLCILFYLWQIGRREILSSEKGWKFIILGFSFIAFGMVLDVTDNFPALNKYVIIGDTGVESFLEKIFGYLLGFTLLAIGFSSWIPQVIQNKKLKQDLLAETKQLKNEVKNRKEEERLRIKSEKKLHQAEKMEAIGLMAGGVAHDLNNILSGIISYPELILMKLPKDHEMVSYVKSIQESGQRATMVVSDLLTIARGHTTAKEVSNLNDLVDEYLKSTEFHKISSFHPEIQVYTDFAHDLANLKCSPVHIIKCVMNLVSNGMESIIESGSITISTKNVEIDASESKLELAEGSYVQLRISDDGPGIPEKNLNCIFEPFYTKKKMGISGTGLGLSIVWNAVKDHRGEVIVESDDSGTTFELYFPSTLLDISVAQHPEGDLSELFGDGQEVLVVDDEKNQREIACELLRTLNYNPTCVGSGEEAVEYLTHNPTPLVILDMIMDNGMNGIETYEKVIEIYPEQKAVASSGYVDDEVLKNNKIHGVSEFLHKPYSITELGLILRKLL